MTIHEYYNNYKITGKYNISLFRGTDATMEDFYQNCISLHTLSLSNVLAWHNMLMDYVERPDAIFWIRYYESGSETYRKKIGRWNNRRGCITKFADGFSYAFVSNYDVQEIYNMIRLGVRPDIDEFAAMMNNHAVAGVSHIACTDAFPMHYDPGSYSEEAQIAGYPHIGSLTYGVLNEEHWYLAHIHGIKSPYTWTDGTCVKVDETIRNKLFPIGNLSDWTTDANGHKVRELNYSLSLREKDIVKAHFLRFVDPLNYFVTPGKYWQKNDVCKTIGEYAPLTYYMAGKYETLYGQTVMSEFRTKALINSSIMFVNGHSIINVSYGTYVGKSSTASATSAMSEEDKLQMAIDYLSDSKASTRSLEKKYCIGSGNAKGGGYQAKKILDDMGLSPSVKGKLAEKSIDELIAEASGKLLNTLNNVKGKLKLE